MIVIGVINTDCNKGFILTEMGGQQFGTYENKHAAIQVINELKDTCPEMLAKLISRHESISKSRMGLDTDGDVVYLAAINLDIDAPFSLLDGKLPNHFEVLYKKLTYVNKSHFQSIAK